jgi:hypothetical protein
MKASLIRWYLTALLLFWGPTAVAFLIEYEAETRGGARSTVLENVLTVPMFLGFLAGAGLWAFAVITNASWCKTSAVWQLLCCSECFSPRRIWSAY